MPEPVKPRLVLGENIAQTAQFVSTRAADIGIIALSLAISDPMRTSGRYWMVPLDSYPRMEQGMGSKSRTLRRGKGFSRLDCHGRLTSDLEEVRILSSREPEITK
jgi:hypothetical protein